MEEQMEEGLGTSSLWPIPGGDMVAVDADGLMASNILAALTLGLPRLPLIIRVLFLHMLGWTQESRYLDLRSAIVISVLRSVLTPSPSKPRSISAVQNLTLRDLGIGGRIWVSTYASPPPPETDLRHAVVRAIMDMREPGTPEPRFKRPEFMTVQGEWTGYRAGVSFRTPNPDVSEWEKYEEMMKEVTQPTTILYLHGGAYYLGDPSTHRPNCRKLAKITGGRCYSVRYRLAPQHPFPSAVLDALVSYFTLLYPPPCAFHEPVKPEHIAIAGDSAGGNLALALSQVLLYLRNNNIEPVWYGSRREVPMPACVAVSSPWLDITQSSPRWQGPDPDAYDFLPKPVTVARAQLKDCDIWPANPARKYLYVDDDLVTHPLASVIMAKSWKGMPPTYICTGWEIMGPENKILGRKMEADGVKLVFEEYEAMPHCFALILWGTAGARRCYDGWTGLIKDAVEGREVKPRALMIRAKSLKEEEMKFEDLAEAGADEENRRRVMRAAALKINGDTVAAKL